MSDQPPAPFDLGGNIGPAVLRELQDIKRLAELVAAMADYTGDARMCRAAGQLRAGAERRGGRPASDDAAALETMAALIATGEARSVEHAAKIVARTIPRSHSLESTIRRLAEKYRLMHRKLP
jgi:hypothetical protein